MKRLFASVLAFVYLLPPIPGQAQYYYLNSKYYGSEIAVEVGASIGAMNCLTDIGGKKGIGKKFIKDLNLNVTKPSFSLYVIAMYKDALGVRLEGTIGGIRAYDSVLKSVAPTTFGRYERNLSFRSRITDVQLAAEIHPLFFKHYDEDEAPYWSPYLVAGIGFFTFNPEANINNHWYALHPLRTEGEGFAEYPDRKPYKLTQIMVPVGIGVKYELGPSMNARLELVHRILFTDYLDDVSNIDYVDPALFSAYLPPAQASLAQQLYDRRVVKVKGSQRGNPDNNDSYFSVQVKIGVTLRSNRR